MWRSATPEAPSRPPPRPPTSPSSPTRASLSHRSPPSPATGTGGNPAPSATGCVACASGPARRPRRTRPPPRKRPDEGSHPMIRVLLADDQGLIRAGFRVLLEAADDIEVVGEAVNGEQAVELARACHPDVILMDIRMPGTDGLAATHAIATDATLDGTKIVILTTFETDEYVYQALRAGGSGFLLQGGEAEGVMRAGRA